jgi:hypothetical protein
MRIALVLTVLFAFAGGPALAEDPRSPALAPAEDTKSAGVAAALSIGSTLVGGIWFARVSLEDGPSASAFYAPTAILVVGPSLGHIYTKSYGLAALGVAARVGGYLVTSAGAGHCEIDPDDIDGCIRIGRNDALYYSGLALMVGGTLAEIVDSPLSATRYNREHAGVSVVPTAAPGSVGLALVGSW